jgi:hypothetical protein
MTLAISTMDPTVQGILFLIAVVLFVVAAVLARPAIWACLVAAGLAFFAFVFCWNAFALS